MSQEKTEVIAKFKSQEEKIVAVIGDGISNASAIAKADLGIATGSTTECC